MEQTCEELRTALQKRYPDSVASLVYATASAGVGADPAELSRVQQDNQALRQELANTQLEGDRKLRSLRQEYERIRLAFEDRLRDAAGQDANSGDYENSAVSRRGQSTSSAAVARRAVALNDGGDRPWSSNKLNPAKNLSQALAKIRLALCTSFRQVCGITLIYLGSWK